MTARGWAVLAIGVQVAAVLAWLWPFGIGGRMPAGGDVTQFSLGLMATLSRALKTGRLPMWNDLWGFGFPGVGESQMGVFYPPHWVFYGLFIPEVGYTISLVVHTLWGSLGTHFAARRFGASATAAAFAGFVFATCGFFLIHLPHQWGYTTGSWMPWAWGLAWSAAGGRGGRRDVLWLALVLAVQLLPGHFQLAFVTQVGVLVLLGEQVVERRFARSSWRGSLSVGLAVGGAFVLAAIQIVPTLRLARLAASRRDFEYLSGFAVSPLHLVSLVAPSLFQRSPLWRPLVWDPFHTSPEECLVYVGLAPLFLALAAVARRARCDAAVRALAVAAAATLLLGMGPYVPGFRLLCEFPGFSFFRGPARWTLGTSLALSLLAGLGFDALREWARPGRWLVVFVGMMGLAAAAAVGFVEKAYGTEGREPDATVARVMAALPWEEPTAYRDAWLQARRPHVDPRVDETWARAGLVGKFEPRREFVTVRWSIYSAELTEFVAITAGLLGLAMLARWKSAFAAGLVVLTVLDLQLGASHRRIETAPLQPLSRSSTVLARISQPHRGVRATSGLGNMPMVVGASPVAAYRTLDLPSMEGLAAVAAHIPRNAEEAEVVETARRLTAVEARIYDPREARSLGTIPDSVAIDDPTLALWQSGRAWGTTYRIASTAGPRPRGWLVPLTAASRAAILGPWDGDVRSVIAAMRDARAVDVQFIDPEQRRIEVETDGTSILVVTELADPQWSLTGPGLTQRTPDRAFGRPNQGAWQAVVIPKAGRWDLELRYRGSDVWLGGAISLAGLAAFGVLFVAMGSGRLAKGRERS